MWTMIVLMAAGLVLPGPNFVLISNSAMASGRSAGVAAAVGVSIGSMTHATLGALGLATIVATSDVLFDVMRIAGAAYLLVIAVKMWRAGSPPSAAAVQTEVAVSRLVVAGRGWLTQMSNPKAILFFLALFTAVLPPDLALIDGVATIGIVGVMATTWYAAVAMVFSHPVPRRLYLRSARLLARVFGGVMVAFAVRVVTADR